MQNCSAEEWRAVPGFPGYEVSDLGRVRSYRTCWGLRETPSLLKPWPDKDGYLSVSLCGGAARGKGKSGPVSRLVRKVYRLVLEAFDRKRLPGEECAHGDGDRSNNALANISWKTHVENERDKVKHGTHTRGERSGTSKVTEEIVRAIRSDTRSGDAVARDHGLSFQQVSRIRRRERWAHVA